MNKKLISGLIVLIIAILAVAAFSMGDNSTSDKSNATEITVAIDKEPEAGFDPLAGWGSAQSKEPLIQSRLFRIDGNLTFINDLATDYQISDDLKSIFESSTQDVLLKVSEVVKRFFSNVLLKLTSIPTMAFYIAITITSLYFICTDKIYMIDQLEHHLPKEWVKRIWRHTRDLTSSLGNYLKAQATLVLISFIISLIGLYIFKFWGLNLKYPFLSSLGIGFL